ncbi:hypothetical protein KGY73_09585 [bacterium]|nr:hypothetical protein [bacterium]
MDIYTAFWFVPEFVRSKHSPLRKSAAESTGNLQIFRAQDVEAAYSREDSPEVRKELKKALLSIGPSR